jgi:hypothetical protein
MALYELRIALEAMVTEKRTEAAEIETVLEKISSIAEGSPSSAEHKCLVDEIERLHQKIGGMEALLEKARADLIERK